MPVINGVYLKDFPALPSSVADANIIPIAISGNQIAYRTTVAGIVTDARVTSKLLTGLSVTGSTILATDTILQAFGKVQNQLNGKVSSVGLTMPAAFNVANSPITSAGTLAVTAAGVASQYIRGDGALADFPTTGGGGSSVSYYLNGSVSQGTFVGNTYYEMNKTPVIGTGTDFTIGADGYIAQFITDANDPGSLLIPAGNWNVEMYFSASPNGGTPSFYVEVYKYDGTAFTLLGSSSATPEGITNGTAIDIYYTSVGIPETVLTITDRLAIRVYVTHSGRTITLHTEDNHLSEIVTTFSNGLTTLNGLTKQAQYFAVGSTGTDFAIVSSVDTHTFNIPDASASARGLITTGTQTLAGAKTLTGALVGTTANFTGQLTLGSTITNGTYTYTLPSATGTLALTSALSDYVPYTGATGDVDLGTNNGITLTDTSTNVSISITSSSIGNGAIYVDKSGAGSGIRVDNNGTGFGFYANNSSTGYGITIGNASTGKGLYIDNAAAATGDPFVYTLGGASFVKAKIDYLGNITGVAGTFTGQLSLGSTITNGTYTYTLPSATGTLALTSDIHSAVTLSAIGSTPNANAATLTGQVLNLQPADASFGGVVTTGTQTIAGAKMFNSDLTVNGINVGKGNNSLASNTSIGVSALASNTTGLVNTAIGNSALNANTDGNFNTAVGFGSLQYNISGISNSALGYVSLSANISGGQNSAFGNLSLTANTTGGSNTAIGYSALTDNISGSNNVGIGYNSGGTLTTGSGNTFIGANVVSGSSSLANNILIGNGTGAVKAQHDGTNWTFTGGATITGVLTLNSTITNGTYTYTLPSATGTLALTSAIPANPVGGTGTTNYVPKFTAASTIGNSQIFDNGTSVGIGTTSPAYPLDVQTASGNTYLNIARASQSTGQVALQLSGGTGGVNWIIFQNTSDNDLRFYGNSAERMRITSGGNVGIGTIAPTNLASSYRSVCVNGSSAGFFETRVSDVSSGRFISDSNATGIGDVRSGKYLYLYTEDTERMRITSGGDVLVGTTTTDVNTVGIQLRPTGLGIFVRSGASCLQLNRKTSDGIIASFRTEDVERGSISITGSETFYNTSSDYRLKEDFKEINSLQIIDKIKVYNFKWKGSEKRSNGVIAHELAEVLPYAVVGKKDEVDKEGNTKYQGVDYSKLVPIMIAAIQELKAEIDLLKGEPIIPTDNNLE